MVSPMIARRGTVATYLHRPEHRPQPRRRLSAHRLPVAIRPQSDTSALDLFQTWLVRVAVLVAMLVVLRFALVLDVAHATALAGMATGWFRRRRGDEEQLDQATEQAWAAVGADTHAERIDTPPVETTEVMKPVATTPAVDEVDAHADDVIALLRERDALREEVEEANRRAARANHLADQTARGAAEAVRFFKRDAAQADEAAQQLRRALEEQRPAPDPHQLGIHLMRVWTRPRPPAVPAEVRWRETAEAAIDAVRVRWPIEAYPLTPAEMEQNAAADAVAAETSPGGGAEVAGPLPAAAPPAPGDSTETGPLSVAEVAELHAIADERLAVDPADAAKVGDELGMGWVFGQALASCGVAVAPNGLVCTRGNRHHGQHVATSGGRVLAVWPAKTSPGGGAAPDAPVATGAPAPGDPTPDPAAPRVSDLQRYARSLGGRLEAEVTVPGDRDQLIAKILVDHEQLPDGTCRCRWAGWPDSTGWPMWHAEHVAQQLRAAGVIA